MRHVALTAEREAERNLPVTSIPIPQSQLKARQIFVCPESSQHSSCITPKVPRILSHRTSKRGSCLSGIPGREEGTILITGAQQTGQAKVACEFETIFDFKHDPARLSSDSPSVRATDANTRHVDMEYFGLHGGEPLRSAGSVMVHSGTHRSGTKKTSSQSSSTSYKSTKEVKGGKAPISIRNKGSQGTIDMSKAGGHSLKHQSCAISDADGMA